MGIAAGAGALIGGLSSFWGNSQEQNRIEHQKDMAWDQYKLGKAYSDQQYTIQKQNASEDLALQKYRLNQSLGTSLDQLNTGLLGQAYGIQDAQIQTASSVGSSLAAEGAGGTRGNAANGLMRAYETQALERNVQLQNTQNSQAVEGIASQASIASQDIARERASWNEGGYRYKMQAAQDDYNLEMAKLGRDNFDWSKGQVADSMPYDIFSGAFSGASSGLSLANSINSFEKLGG
jgi:hypothetical protein